MTKTTERNTDTLDTQINRSETTMARLIRYEVRLDHCAAKTAVSSKTIWILAHGTYPQAT